MSSLISVDEALRRVLAFVPEPRPRKLPTSQCAGLVLAAPVRSMTELPGFDNSSVDGYAVLSRDVRGVSRERPAVLKLIESIWAGDWPRRVVKSGFCSRIATGAPLPRGADAVVMQEDTRPGPNARSAVIRSAVREGENVRRRGRDVRKKSILLRPGHRLRPMDLMLAAQTGNGELVVYPRPKVAVLSTGNELVAAGRRLPQGKIYDGNSEGLASLSAWVGGEVAWRGRVSDDPKAIRRVLANCLRQADIVVTCAGVSVGEKDWLRRILRSLGGRERFWRVSMKPGRPLALFTLGRKLVLCLPGNPVSAFVTFLLFVKPVLEKLARKTSSSFTLRARLAHAIPRTGRRQFLRGRLRQLRDGPTVSSSGGQDSHMLSSLVNADCLFEIPEGRGRLSRGASIRVFPFTF